MRKKFALFVFVFLLVSCASPTPEPTATPLPSPTSTAAPTSTETPEPTPTTTLTPEPTPDNSNLLTYKNANGQEVTVELATYKYTNSKGEVVEIVQPLDQMACLKLLADKLQWYPPVTEQMPLLHDMASPDAVLWDLLSQYDISFPPKDKRTW